MELNVEDFQQGCSEFMPCSPMSPVSRQTFIALAFSVVIGVMVGAAVYCAGLAWVHWGGVRLYWATGNSRGLFERACETAVMWVTYISVVNGLWALVIEGLLLRSRPGCARRILPAVLLATGLLIGYVFFLRSYFRWLELGGLVAGAVAQAAFLATCRPGRGK